MFRIYTTEEFKKLIEQRNIKYSNRKVFLEQGEEYRGAHTKTNFVCENQHIWSTTPSIVLRGSGCSVCFSYTHDDFMKSLERRNSRYPDKKVFLVPKQRYQKNAHIKLGFFCENQHQWQAQPNNILQGSSCPICPRYTEKQFLKILEDRNIKYSNKKVFLIPNQQYQKAHTKMKFVCENQHQWSTTPTIILQGIGCPTCANKSYSYPAIAWLNQLMETTGNHIIHNNNGGEYLIPGTKYRVDGFCFETNTVYEFYGDFWHGNPKKYQPNKINNMLGLTYQQLFEKTKQREQQIKALGYNMITIWESDYKRE